MVAVWHVCVHNMCVTWVHLLLPILFLLVCDVELKHCLRRQLACIREPSSICGCLPNCTQHSFLESTMLELLLPDYLQWQLLVRA
jgi:hypothetical protein